MSMGVRLALLGLVALALQGCAAVALPAVGAAVLTSSAGAAARAGTEYTLRGNAYRTFSRSLDEVRGATLQTLDHADVAIVAVESTGRGNRIVAQANRRTISITLESLAPSLTRMRVSVRQGLFGRDRATTSELVVQTAARLAGVSPPVITGLDR
jgi:hypothetical protein